MNVINIDREILGDTPVFDGTRVPIKNLFDYLETGETIDGFLDDFPSVRREQIIKLLEPSEQITIKSRLEGQDEEREDWTRFALANLERAYGDDEPEYNMPQVMDAWAK